MKLFTLKKLWFAVRCVLSVSILIYLLTIIDRANLSTLISGTNFTYAWLAPVLVLLGLYFAAIRWHILLSSLKINQAIVQCFRFYLIGSFYSIVLPGVIGGDAVRISLSSLSKKRVLEITSSVFVERLLGFIVLLILGSFTTQILPQSFAYKLGNSLIQTLYLTTSVFLVVLLILYGLLQKLPERWLTEKNSSKFFNISIQLLKIFKKISLLQLLVVAFWTALFQSSDIIASFILANSIGISLPLSPFFVIIPIIYIVTLLPISLGGLGVREGALTYLLSGFGVAPADAVICALLIYLNRLFVSSIGGVIQFFGKS